MTITVTEEHIRSGEPDDCEKCAVALAVIEATGARMVTVDPLLISIYIEDTRQDIETPFHVSEFIYDFDEGNPVDPISFEVALQPPR